MPSQDTQTVDVDVEYLDALQFDLRQKAGELGGPSLMNWLVENASNFLRVSDPEETAVNWPEADLRRIYSQHVHAKVLPFQTHLPQYTLAAAAGTVGGLRRIDHVTLLSPRRFVLGNVVTTEPAESSTSSFMSPKMCRFWR